MWLRVRTFFVIWFAERFFYAQIQFLNTKTGFGAFMRSDKKDIRKVRKNNLIFGTSTVTTACLYYGLRLGNVIYQSTEEIGLFEAMAQSMEKILSHPFALFPSDIGSVLIFLTVALIADIYMLNEYIFQLWEKRSINARPIC